MFNDDVRKKDVKTPTIVREVWHNGEFIPWDDARVVPRDELAVVPDLSDDGRRLHVLLPHVVVEHSRMLLNSRLHCGARLLRVVVVSGAREGWNQSRLRFSGLNWIAAR